jgi:hypothetical protein
MEVELAAALKNAKGLWPAAVVALVWIGKELVSRWLTDVAENKTGLIELRKEIHELTIAVTKLTLQIEYLQKGLEAIPEMKKDLDGLGEKVRRMHPATTG